ncbi:MAG: cyclic nucleotide-binding domain-containing protein [Anaerolineae bacterium]|jgi:CRP-like cAMP-binding protein|nr:cyclic nucleotide-binding domain-containing protein [Anaerolineae bacterium]MBT7074484.1 cyclic nucleotide-binding domain-containing protein [Anaerolineae bacterium]MBT7783604.1 cyclic nucleotide-binding domain-containing protein [Anaerolineae bacterium]
MDSAFENFPLFKGLNKETLRIIKPLFESCTCHKGIIFEQGDPAVYLYFVIEGSIDILYKPYDAPSISITSVKSGDVFGWSAIAGDRAYTSGAACKTECQAMRIQGEDLRNLCIQHPQTGEILLDRLAESVSTRWQNAHTQVRDILTQGILNTS